MAVTNGQEANQDTFNNAFVSKTQNSTTIGKLDLNNGDSESGVQITNSQRQHNSIASFVGALVNQVNNYLPTWVTNNVGLATDSLFARIAALDVFAGTKGQADGIAPLDSSSQVPLANLPDSVTGARRFLGNWSASTNTPTLADGDSNPAGDEYNVSDDGTVDFGSGNITFTNGDTVIYNGSVWSKIDGSVVRDLNDIRDVSAASPSDREVLRYISSNWQNFNPDQIGNDAATGANATLSAPGDLAIVRLTDGGLTSIDEIPAPAFAQRFVLVNATGVQVTVNNDTGSTPANQILTGSGSNLDLSSDGVLIFVYDTTTTRWRITGGSGGGGVNTTLSNLDAPTAVNQDLLMDTGASANIKTTDGIGASSRNIDFKSGDTGDATAATGSGNVTFSSGTGTNEGTQFSGDVGLRTGNASGTSGSITISPGTGSSRGVVRYQDGSEGTVGHVLTGVSAIGETKFRKPSYEPLSVLFGVDSDFESADETITWTNYADAVSNIPEDGTGGSPSISSPARTTTLSELVNGDASLRLSKGAADERGEGWSLDLSVSRAFRGMSVRVSMNYIATANFDYGTTSTDSDVTVWGYDVTNSTLLPLNNKNLTGEGRIESDVFIPSTCEDFRLILHISTTNASSWDLIVDDVRMDIVPFSNFNNLSDWVDAGTITIGADTSAPTKGTTVVDAVRYRQDGKDWVVEYDFEQSAGGSAGSGEYIFSLPDGIEIDTDFITPFTGTVGTGSPTGLQQALIGYGHVTDGTNRGGAYAFAYDSKSFKATVASFFGGYGGHDSAFFPIGGTDGWCYRLRFPGKGITSGARQPASIGLNANAVFSANTSSTAGSSSTPFDFTNVLEDSLGGYSAGTYTVRSPGNYYINARSFSTTSHSITIFVNGSEVARQGGNSSAVVGGVSHFAVNLNYGDTIDIRPSTNATASGNPTDNAFQIFKESTQQQPYAPRTVTYTHRQSSGTNGGGFTSGSYQKVPLTDVSGDQSYTSESSDVLSTEAGKYRAWIYVTGYQVGAFRARLRDTDNNVNLVLGSSSSSNTTDGDNEKSSGFDVFNLTSTTNLELQAFCNTTNGTDGYGEPVTSGDDEVYAELILEKIL